MLYPNDLLGNAQRVEDVVLAHDARGSPSPKTNKPDYLLSCENPSNPPNKNEITLAIIIITAAESME